jgi:hypothetical protein
VQVVPWDGSGELRAATREAAPAKATAREEPMPAFAK